MGGCSVDGGASRSGCSTRREREEVHTEGASDVVEVALAGALAAAAQVGEWGLVERLARELEARRRASGGAS
jgi:hypothetical protein